MKLKCTTILKSSIALILTVLMLVGSFSTVLAATVEVAGTGATVTNLNRVKFHADLSGYTGSGTAMTAWSNQSLTAADSNHYYGTFYTAASQSQKEFGWNVGGSNWGDSWCTMNGEHFTATQTYEKTKDMVFSGSNDKVSTISATSGWVKLQIDWYGSYSNSSYVKFYQTAVTALSSSVSAGSTTLTAGSTTTITPSSSGGTGTPTNSVKVYQGSASGTDVTSSVLSGTTFTAPNVASTTKYYVINTATDSTIKSYTKASSATIITVNPASTTYNNIAVAAKYSTTGADNSYTTNMASGSATISANSYTTGSSALTITAGDVSGYSFYKWVVTAGSGTIGSATTANTTFTPSASNTTVTAQYKKSYTISKNTPSNGTITLSKTSAVAGETFKVTLAPSSGYRVATFTVGGVDKKSSLNSSNEYTHTCTGTTDSIAVNATFEAIPGTTIYIKKTMPTFSYAHFYDPDNNDNNISVAGAWPGDKFTSWSTTSDGKYYYKTYTWNCSNFKMILNDNGSNQTGSGTSVTNKYATGKSYYIDTATNGTQVTLTEGVPSAKAITYTSTYASSSDVTWGGTKPATAYPGEEVSFTVSAKSGYRLASVKYNDGTDHTITATSGTYKFTMPASAVTVTATTVKTYTVTLTAGDGFASKKYAIGSGSDQTYSSAITVDSGSSVALKVTYTTGYEYDSTTSSLDGAVASNSNKTFTLSNITANKTVNLKAQKITWSGLTAVGKYSTTAANDASYNNDFPAGSAPNVTIAATSATQLDGVAVSAPATDPEGYVFAGWYTTTGSFTAPNDKDTTFKPNAANAVAIAKYKKIFTITSSVDNTGTGAGTVTTSKTSVEAGGSYTITATAKSGSAIESIMVGSTNKGTNASTTISSVSADQVVKVKFESNVKLKGTMNPTAWSGEVMTAADKSVASYSITKELAANTTYSFKHFVESDTWSTTVSSWNLNNVATHSTDNDGNLTITPSVKVNVTFTSDGSKFTSITAVPADATKYNVTFKKVANTTITGEYMGTAFTTASADAVVQVYKGTDIEFTVASASGYHISNLTGATFSPTFSNTTYYASKSYTVSNVTEAKTVTPTAAADVNVSAVTNKKARGTVAIDKNKTFKGDTVKITVTPLAGTLKSLTATYSGSGKTYEYKNSNWTEVIASGSAAAPTSFNPKDVALAAVGALVDHAPVGASQTINMVMQDDSNVTINAIFDTYSADSTWYYNGYDTSGNALSGYHSKQMTESMVSGEKFSYYHVEGRTGTDQLMTVSDGKVETGTRYVYFTQLKSGGWDYSHSPYAYFIGASNSWPGYEMTWYTDNDMGQPVYRVEIPSGATGVVFNDNSTHKSTDINDLASGGYYVDEYSTWDGSNSVHTGHSYSCSYPSAGASSSGTEYFYGSDNDVSTIYSTDNSGKSIFGTTGFYRHGTNNKNYAKPRLTDSDKGDYYVNVLYPGKTYTINGVTKTIGTDPVVIWSTEPLAGDDENVTIYAKDGAIRAETFGSTYANIADTKIYAANGTSTVGTKHSGSITNQTYETYKGAKGDTIVIKTQIGATDSSTLSDATDLKNKYYVRGFCVNGEVSELLEWNANGLYTLTFKIPEDTEITKFEITPIYYLKDTEANPIVTYRVTGFTDDLKQVGSGKPGWGDTLYTYPFYGKLGGQNNAFGAYPGQPMVYYKGQYQMQIPVKSTAWDPYDATASTVNNTTVSGVTMSNGYWDSVHKSIMGYGDNSTSADHVQTYDYGDFYKIFNEKKPVDNIVFDFKYRTAKHNLADIITSNTIASALNSKYGTGGNGFELLTNFHGKNVDLFGTPLSGAAADPTQTTPVYVVSTGGVIDNTSGVENIAGYYATEWVVYGNTSGTTYQRISAGNKNSIPPEVLILNDDDTTSFNDTTYPSADANHKLTDWKALYTALEAYRGKPVMISYEAADAQQGQGMYYTGTGGATRNDGRWLYSKTGENITSTIKIQYSDDNGDTYTDLDKTNPQVQGLSAYFTNDGVEGEMTYATTIDPDKTFDFEAKTTNANYKFVGWYMADGTKITSDNASHTERSGSYTFVAKFMQVQGGQLILSHSADKGTIGGTDYQGAGTAKISAVVKDGEEVIRTYDLTTSDITLDDKIIKSDSTYTIEVTLTATATGSDVLGPTVLANPDGQDTTYFSAASTTTEGKTKTIVLNSFTVASLFSGTTQNVKNIIYHSYFTQAVFHYKLKFEYTDRFGNDKVFYREGNLTSAQAANENYVERVENGAYSTRYLRPAFIETIAPHVSNFGEDITWNLQEKTFSFTVNDYYYNCDHYITATTTGNNKRNVTFKLPYEHTNGIATGGNSGTAATTTDFELIGDNAVTFDTIPVLLNDAENGIYTEEGKKNWIAAPATLSDNGTTKYFQYWSVKNTDADGDEDPEVARCYFQGFNFVALDNYTVTPIYDVSPTDITKSGIYTGVSFLETSRNQWNDNQNRQKGETDKASDLLYNDFILNYNFNGAEIYNNGDDVSDIQELGVVVERVQELGIKQDGSKDTDISHYTSLATDIENVLAAANTATVGETGQVTYKANNKQFYKQIVDKTSLDNKNRIKFYDAFYNGAGWSMENQTSATKYTYKNYVYRAYTYIKYTSGGETIVKLADAPAYFTMYDEATATYAN